MEASKIVSRDEWLEARRALLVQEKAHMRAGDALAEARRALPRVKIEKSYAFDTEQGRKTLAQLFGDRSQLIVLQCRSGVRSAKACLILQGAGFERTVNLRGGILAWSEIAEVEA